MGDISGEKGVSRSTEICTGVFTWEYRGGFLERSSDWGNPFGIRTRIISHESVVMYLSYRVRSPIERNRVSFAPRSTGGCWLVQSFEIMRTLTSESGGKNLRTLETHSSPGFIKPKRERLPGESSRESPRLRTVLEVGGKPNSFAPLSLSLPSLLSRVSYPLFSRRVSYLLFTSFPSLDPPLSLTLSLSLASVIKYPINSNSVRGSRDN